MKSKKLSMVLGLALVITILAGFAAPFAGAAGNVAVKVLNPLGKYDIQKNTPLASRDKMLDEKGNIDLNGKVIGISTYSKPGNKPGLDALGDLLIERYPGVLVVDTGVADLGSPWYNKTPANYDLWGGVTPLSNTVNTLDGKTGARGRTLDAVIFGISD
ncbi:MAG: hypothetical protein LBH28_03910 [Oscillospiraceae bacterium]|jgi:hypothetical protein|nr:hypothetical protein [Oscillospiraceae bacterium]